MATPLFYETYGIGVDCDTEGVYSSSLKPNGLYNNWGPHVFGGCYCIMGNALLQHMAGPGMFGTHYACRFLRGVPLGNTITASAETLKRGRTFVDSFARIEGPSGLAFTMEATYAAASSFPGNAYAPVEELPEFTFVANRPDDTGVANADEPFQTMISYATYIPQFEEKIHDGRACVGLYTDERFADVNGFLDASVFCAIVDACSSMAAIRTNLPSVTCGLTCDLFEPVYPGALLACAVEVNMASGSATSTRGTLWADGHMVGTCSNTFFSTPDVKPPTLYDFT